MRRIVDLLLSILESVLAIIGIVLIVWLIHYVHDSILLLF